MMMNNRNESFDGREFINIKLLSGLKNGTYKKRIQLKFL